MDKMNRIKIWLCVLAWIAVTITVVIAITITKSPACLWAFVIPAWVTSDADLMSIDINASTNKEKKDKNSTEDDDLESEIVFRNSRIK